MKNFPSNYVSLKHRTEAVIESMTPEKARFSWLEEQTGIPRTTWQSFSKRSTALPSGEMIQALARLFPRYAFWLVSGLTDREYGHTTPEHAWAKNFPEEDHDEERKRFDDYFHHCMTMQMKVYDGSTKNYDRDDVIEAKNTLKRLARLRRAELDMLLIEKDSLEKERSK